MESFIVTLETRPKFDAIENRGLRLFPFHNYLNDRIAYADDFVSRYGILSCQFVTHLCYRPCLNVVFIR